MLGSGSIAIASLSRTLFLNLGTTMLKKKRNNAFMRDASLNCHCVKAEYIQL